MNEHEQEFEVAAAAAAVELNQAEHPFVGFARKKVKLVVALPEELPGVRAAADEMVMVLEDATMEQINTQDGVPKMIRGGGSRRRAPGPLAAFEDIGRRYAKLFAVEYFSGVCDDQAVVLCHNNLVVVAVVVVVVAVVEVYNEKLEFQLVPVSHTVTTVA